MGNYMSAAGATAGVELSGLEGASLLRGPAEAFAETTAGKALLDVAAKFGTKALGGTAFGIGYAGLHKAAKLLGLAPEK
jgi:hypothetical protein